MTRLRLFHVDAFASRPFTGNPAAVVLLEQELSEEAMQAIAAEMNLPATVFALPASGGADYEIRWFGPAREIMLCGHGTLAAAHVLIAGEAVRFRSRHSGLLEVTRDGELYRVSLPAAKPEPRPLDEFVAALGCSPIATLWHPRRYAVVVLRAEQEVLELAPDFGRLAALGDVLTIVTAPGSNTDIVSRAFAPASGSNEDPVTGSAHAVIVPYWAERLGRSHLSAYQASRRGGFLECRLEGDRVVLGGRCVTVVEGVLRLSNPS